ncbi:MAG: SurA N-terminal domain-containing protein, partial [Polynucleobacter victoriensis]
MLESIRKYQKLLMGLLLLLILPSFVFLGIESYVRDMGKDSDLVKVNGVSITRQELDNAVKARADRLQQQQGRVDSAMVNSVPFKQSVLGEIIQQRLLAYELKSLKLAVSPEALARDLTQIPEIKALYRDGKFDNDRYVQLLKSNGMTVDQFEGTRRYELMTRHVLTSVMATGIGSRKVAEKVSQALETEREVQVLRFIPADFLSKVNPTQQDLEAYYQANVAAYQAPETIDVEYVVLQADTKDAKAYAEKADLFANMAYEQPDSLSPVANRLKLAVQTFKGVTRGGANALSADHPLNNPKVLAAIFSDDAIKNRRNIEALE